MQLSCRKQLPELPLSMLHCCAAEQADPPARTGASSRGPRVAARAQAAAFIAAAAAAGPCRYFCHAHLKCSPQIFLLVCRWLRGLHLIVKGRAAKADAEG
jgi:hypothetical protein